MPPARYRDYLVETVQKGIRTLVRDLLLYHEASKRLSPQENEMIDQFTDQRIRQIVQEQHGGRQVRWQRAMAEQGLSPEEARQRVRREVTTYAFLERTIMPKVAEPTRRELMRYFEQRKAELTIPERREMFLIEVPKGEDAQAAQATIQRVRSELDAGGDFQDAARKYSQGIHAADGGAWGMVTPQSLRGRWVRVAEVLGQLAPDTTSEVIEGEECFFLVRLGRVEPGLEPDFADVQVRLKQAYREHQFNLLIDEQVARLHEQAVIRPADPSLFLRAVLEACPAPSSGDAPLP
jgi:parvulin-like peptidyl-prolyl isomerase